MFRARVSLAEYQDRLIFSAARGSLIKRFWAAFLTSVDFNMGAFLAKFVASEYAGHVLEENFGPQVSMRRENQTLPYPDPGPCRGSPSTPSSPTTT